jgi:hypothetical protein
LVNLAFWPHYAFCSFHLLFSSINKLHLIAILEIFSWESQWVCNRADLIGL